MKTSQQTSRANGQDNSGAFPTDKEIFELIAEAAYFRAQKRGFTPGLEAEDWAAAEAEVRARLQAPRTSR